MTSDDTDTCKLPEKMLFLQKQHCKSNTACSKHIPAAQEVADKLEMLMKSVQQEILLQ